MCVCACVCVNDLPRVTAQKRGGRESNLRSVNRNFSTVTDCAIEPKLAFDTEHRKSLVERTALPTAKQLH